MDGLCEQCSNNPHKYKCPKCTIKYCSAACFKAHPCQQILESAQLNNKSAVPNQFYEEGGDAQNGFVKTDFVEDEQLRLSKASLRALRDSDTLKKMLQNKTIRDALLNIDNSKNRIKALQMALKDPEFQAVADQILKALGVVDQEGKIS